MPCHPIYAREEILLKHHNRAGVIYGRHFCPYSILAGGKEEKEKGLVLWDFYTKIALA
jgi:hypothetical protein